MEYLAMMANLRFDDHMVVSTVGFIPLLQTIVMLTGVSLRIAIWWIADCAMLYPCLADKKQRYKDFNYELTSSSYDTKCNLLMSSGQIA